MDNLRDHLANERTFLAWIRTSIGLMAFGFVVEKFSIFLNQISFFLGPKQIPTTSSVIHPAYAFGIILILLGTLLSLFSFIKFKKVEKQIEASAYRTATFLDTVLAFAVILMGILLMIYLYSSKSTLPF